MNGTMRSFQVKASNKWHESKCFSTVTELESAGRNHCSATQDLPLSGYNGSKRGVHVRFTSSNWNCDSSCSVLSSCLVPLSKTKHQNLYTSTSSEHMNWKAVSPCRVALSKHCFFVCVFIYLFNYLFILTQFHPVTFKWGTSDEVYRFGLQFLLFKKVIATLLHET